MKCSRALLELLIAAALLGAAGAEAARFLPALVPAPQLESPSFSAAELLEKPAADTAGDRPFRLISPALFSLLTSSTCSVPMTHRSACTVCTADFHSTSAEGYRLYLAWRPDLPQPEPIVSWKTASGDFDKLAGANVWVSLELAADLRRPTFQGLWTDPTTGLSYARNRWYDARTASWLSTDPLGPVDSQNLYAFVGWAPHMGTDPMGKAVYAFDGTNNDRAVMANPTNVAILVEAYDGFRHYEAGPGTAAGIESAIGGATGFGSRFNVAGAYRALVERFNDPNNPDREIVILGFSRGAAAAREFANMIYEQGIPDLTSGRQETRVAKMREGEMTYQVTVFDRYFEAPEILFLGLFDTVASMGVAGNRIDLTYSLSIPPNVQNVRHAISVEETRRAFPLASAIDLENPDDPRIVERGFCGSHSDVGGGYDDNNVASRRPLMWMWQEADSANVPLNPLPTEHTRLDQPIVWHDSRMGSFLWWIIDVIPDIKYGRHIREVYHYSNPQP